MSINAVISSRCALRRCTCAAGGTMSVRRLLTRVPSSLTSSMSRSPSLLMMLPSSRWGEVRRGARGSLPLRLGHCRPGESHAQLAVLDRCAAGVSLRKDVGQGDLAAVVADGDIQLAVVPAQVNRRSIHERNFDAEHVIGSVLVDALRTRVGEMLGRILRPIRGLGHALQHLDTHDLAIEKRHIENRDADERLLDLDLITLVNPLPFLEELIVKLVGEDAVDDHSVSRI